VKGLVVALLAPFAVCFAQTATVSGIVTDTSDAVIVGASLAISNLDTGLRREAQTNDSGAFSFNLLPVGRYKLSASHPGFGASERPEIKLDVDQVARIDFKLKPGAVTESVQVTAAAALLDSETSTVGQVISNKNIVELPLNGRNYLNLASLTAGTAPSVGGRTAAEGGFVAGGQHGYQVNIMVDGLDNNSVASGGPLGFEAQGVKPSIDAVGEFKVVTNNLSAEYGGKMGGTVLVNLKSGTNQLHGTAFEFLRNDKLDGTNFFANRNGAAKPEYRQNQFGGTLGGPIRKNRTFLFGSFEGSRIRTGTSSISTVPTVDERDGDFSKIRAIYDPQTTVGTGSAITRQPFAGGVIPKFRWDPLFPALLALYPLPTNNKIVNNYFFSSTDRNSTNTYDFKGDHNITDRARLSIRYSRRDKDQFQNGPLPLPADGGLATTTWITSHSVVASYTQNLGPRTNNELRFGFSRIGSAFDIPYDKPLFDQFGIKGIPKTNLALSNDHGLSRFTPAGYAELGSRSFWPNTNNLDLLQFNDVLFRSAGSHSLKAGVEFKHENIYRNAARFARGQFAFNREFTADPQNRGATGDGLAEFMLGWAAGGTLGNENGENAMVRTLGAFFQDDWKVSSRLTLNLGLRYDLFFVPTFPDGGVSNFILDYSGAGTNAQLKQVRQTGPGDCGCEQNTKNFGPRLGLAYRLGAKTVLRAGAGLIYAQGDYLTDQVARLRNQSPDFVEIGFATLDRITPRLVLKDGFPAVTLPATTVPGPASVGVSAQQTNMADQYSEQWFFDIQHELPFDILATVGYQGNGTHHMLISMDYDLPFGPASSTVASRRIFPYYTAVTRLVPMGNLSYNALIWKMEKRFSRGFTFLSAFTWAHAIDNLLEPLNNTSDQGPVVPYNRQLNRANSNSDIRRTYAFSSTYELPFGRGKAMLNRGGALNAILGGWQVSGILTLRSGIPFTVTTSGGITNAGGADRPNRLADGTLPADQRSIDGWFDLTAFKVQPSFTYGNAGRNILFGPGLRNIDLSIGKSFPLGETRRLQVRAESFNFTNTPAFGQPAPNINSLGPAAITSAGDPRRLQFGLKFVM
jgi:hypothetical protein